MRRTTAIRLMSVLVLLTCTLPAEARRRRRRAPDPKPAVIAWLPVAKAALAKDDLAKAVQALQGARACWAEHGARCGFERVDYELLLAATYLAAGDAAKAAPTLERVLAERPDETSLWLHLAQARFTLEDWAGAADAYAKGEAAADDQPLLYARWARAHLKAEAPTQALRVLARGLERLPDAPVLHRELALLYARFGRFEAAFDQAVGIGDPTERLQVLKTVASGLMDAGDLGAAAEVYEAARLFGPDNPELLGLHAHALAAQGNPVSAARLFDRQGAAHAAAEQYRLAGRTADALRLNGRVTDDRKRLRQRLDILLGAERWAAAFALAKAVEPYADDQVRYRLAYAALRAGEPAAARRMARASRLPGAKRLAKAARQCIKTPWVCP